MKCTKCGNEIGNARFCQFCGSEQTTVPLDENQLLTILISKASGGDAQAKKDLIQSVYNELTNDALGLTGNVQDAQEVMKNTCISILSGLNTLSNTNQFRSWAKAIVRQHAVDLLNQKYGLVQNGLNENLLYDPSDEKVQLTSDLPIDSASVQNWILDCVNTMPADQRAVSMMYFYDQMKLNEISSELEMPAYSVVTKLQQAKEHIKQNVQEQGDKYGTVASSLPPMGLFLSLLAMWRDHAKAADAEFLKGIAGRIGAGIGGTAVSAAMANKAAVAGSAAAKAAAASAGVKAAVGIPLAGKIAIGALAGCIAIAGTVGIRKLINNQKKEEPVDEHLMEEEYGIVAEARPTLVDPSELMYTEETVAELSDTYTVSADFSNVLNADLLEYYTAEEKQMLIDQNFFVKESSGIDAEFFYQYEEHADHLIPNFVTVDCVLHSFHLIYATIQENIERDYLSVTAQQMALGLLEVSKNQYATLKGTEWEEAAQRNVDYFSVAAALAGAQVELSSAASADYNNVMEAASPEGKSEVLSTKGSDVSVNYTAFKPQGYYESTEQLQQYFRTMSWYGNISYTQSNEELDRSALLMTLAMDDASVKDTWETLYKVTTFFAGESNDNGYYEYLPIIRKVYGDVVSVDQLAGQKEKFEEYHKITAALKEPSMNSKAVTLDGEMVSLKGYRVMGKRFSIDGNALYQLVYPNVEKDSSGNTRNLPSPLEVPAVLGSEEASNIVTATTNATSFPNYSTQLEKARNDVNALSDEDWNKSVSTVWLNSIRPLARNDYEGYPQFMQSDAWKRKNLNSFLGSYTELKHDMVLYTEVVGAGLGADGSWNRDSRGYVEPEPEVFGRLSRLAEGTKNGLAKYAMISDNDSYYLDRLASLSSQLSVIAQKELRNELPSDAEFELIKTIGHEYLEGFWKKSLENRVTEEELNYVFIDDYPASLITDFAYDNDAFTALQIAEGYPQEIVVLVNFDGHIRPAFGMVYSYYELEVPQSDKYTDSSWKEALRDNSKVFYLPEWQSTYNSSAYVKDESGAIGTLQITKGSAEVYPTTKTWGSDPIETLTAGDTLYPVYGVLHIDYYESYYKIGENRWVEIGWDAEGKFQRNPTE